MKEIKLTQNKVALIDDEYYESASKCNWCAQKIGNTFYAVTNRNTYRMYLHHFIVGCPLNKLTVDHIDNDGLNNQLHNLRIITNRQNVFSRKSGKLPGTTKHKGKFQAAIRWNGKYLYLGRYKTEFEAFSEYRKYLLLQGGELLPEHELLYQQTISLENHTP